MDADGIPLAFDMYPGNQNEQTTLKPLETRSSEFLAAPGSSIVPMPGWAAGLTGGSTASTGDNMSLPTP